MPTVTTDDDVTLSYIDRGSGPVLLLVAGFCAPATSWALQHDAFVDAGYRVVALDRRGHGDSQAPEHGATMMRHGRDVANVLDALDLTDAVLIGGSMGASTNWSYISQFGTDRVRAVVSVDQTPKMVNGAGWSNGFYGLTEANESTFFDNGIPDTKRGLPRRKALLSMVKLVVALRGMPEMASPDTAPMRALLGDHARQDWRGTVTAMDRPFLMLAGRESQFWPAAHASDSVGANPLGKSVVLEDCGHAANMDRPADFNAAVLEFVGSF
ncbi:alpha/beta hydrolase [Rhodococcoides trifolii]|uniref:Alpha/beta hydrolase n=1 Tax=Rhodococcoides trifolii TaxID=908250 RepID=A0A917FYY8_9NOCA|nr:alpha/beta hydrolase [Rhodococcus trifolii]GGG14704.1 alpha/beta hydrolase [Rhodococcus trifolii]